MNKTSILPYPRNPIPPKQDSRIVQLSPTGVCSSYIISKQYYKGSTFSGSTNTQPLKRIIVSPEALENRKLKEQEFKHACLQFPKIEPDKIKKLLTKNEPRPLSTRTRRKIRNKTMVFFNHFRSKNKNQPFTFWTLTINSKHVKNHSECNTMLNTFLTRMRKLQALQGRSVYYLWVNELQKNGQIHYHIIANQFMNVRTLNHYWVKTLQNNGFEISDNANPVDVRNKTNLNAKQLSCYLTKYVTKNGEDSTERGVYALRWNCSQFISRLPTKVYFSIKETDYQFLKEMQKFTIKKTGVEIKIEDFEILDIGLRYLSIIQHSGLTKHFLSILYANASLVAESRSNYFY